MTAKEYLNQAYQIDRQIHVIRDKIDKMRDIATYKSPNFEDTGSHTSNNNATEDKILKLVEYEKQNERLINKLIDKRNEIERSISRLADPVQREILERRYLLYEPWERHYDSVSGRYVKGIVESMGYSRRRTFQLHGEALKNIALNCIELHL